MKAVIALLGCVCVVVLAIVMGLKDAFDFGYHTGQVDALHGVFKYEILKASDGTEHVVEKARKE